MGLMGLSLVQHTQFMNVWGTFAARVSITSVRGSNQGRFAIKVKK